MGGGDTEKWWPGTGLNRRHRPLQGVNIEYLQLLTRRLETPKYAEICVRRANHGWSMWVEISAVGVKRVAIRAVEIRAEFGAMSTERRRIR
jgi:hypothetical protein